MYQRALLRHRKRDAAELKKRGVYIPAPTYHVYIPPPVQHKAPSTSSAAAPGVVKAVATNVAYDSEFLVEIEVGSQKTKMQTVFDTGSSDLWLFNTQCSACSSSSHSLFNPSGSSSFKKGSGPAFSLLYGDGTSASGYYATDKLTLGSVSFSQSIGIATSISASLNDAILDGIVGLGYKALSSNRINTPLNSMYGDNLLTQDVFGVQLIKASSSNSGGGAYVFGGYDSSAVRGSFSTTPVTQQAYWQIKVPTITVGNTKQVEAVNEMIIDTGTTLILLSSGEATNVYSGLPGGEYDSSVGGFKLFCNATDSQYSGRQNVYFNIGGHNFGIPAADMLWEQIDDEYCYGAIQSWGSGFSVSILGDVFLKNAYVVFDQGNNQIRVAQRSDVAALSN